MKQLEVTLNVDTVCPLIDYIRPICSWLDGELALPLESPETDPELRDIWSDGLLQGQTRDCIVLLGLFEGSFPETGQLVIDSEQGEPVLRASTAIRLRIRDDVLSEIPAEQLESGEVDFDLLSVEEQMGFSAYLFLATLQDLVINHLYA